MNKFKLIWRDCSEEILVLIFGILVILTGIMLAIWPKTILAVLFAVVIFSAIGGMAVYLTFVIFVTFYIIIKSLLEKIKKIKEEN